MEILFALSITLLIEPLICALMDKFNCKVFVTSSAANIILNVLMNVILLNTKNYDVYVKILVSFEIATIFIEALAIWLICKIKFPRVLAFTFLGNFASWMIGELFNLFAFYSPIITVICFIFYFTLLTLIIIFNHVNNSGCKENN